MLSTVKIIVLLVSVASLAAGCSTHPPHPSRDDSPGNSAVVQRAIAPRRGVPIHPMGATKYFEEQTALLVQQGKIGTNLLRDVALRRCSLRPVPCSGRSLTPTELAESVEMGVAVVGVVVRMKKGPPQLLPSPASGFFLSQSGALVTCRHVVEAPYVIGLSVMTRDGRVCPVREVLAVDSTNDLLIVQVEGEGFTPIPVAPVPAPQAAPIWVLSHPQWRYYTLSSGIVSSYFMAGKEEVLQMQVTADFAGGSSGAPAFNERGEVVGIAKLTEYLNSHLFDAKGRHVQMVWRVCTPSTALLNLIME